jgi:hypothetical protein
MAVCGVWFRPADNKRVSPMGAMGGWDQMRSRLRHDQLFFFSTFTEAIRTIPLLQHDQDRPEDLDTEAEDHAADSVRYALHVPTVNPLYPPAERRLPKSVDFAESDVIRGIVRARSVHKDGNGHNCDWSAA